MDTQVPQDWKRTNVTPILKKGHRNLPENYRSLNLTSVVSKVFESLLRLCSWFFEEDYIN